VYIHILGTVAEVACVVKAAATTTTTIGISRHIIPTDTSATTTTTCGTSTDGRHKPSARRDPKGLEPTSQIHPTERKPSVSCHWTEAATSLHAHWGSHWQVLHYIQKHKAQQITEDKEEKTKKREIRWNAAFKND
jgi:hypothetical protein